VKARRSEGPKERLQNDQGACAAKINAQTSAARVGNHVHAARTRNRPDGAAILSGQERGIPDNMRTQGRR